MLKHFCTVQFFGSESRERFFYCLSICLLLSSCQNPPPGDQEQNNTAGLNSATTETNDQPPLKPGHIVMQVSDLERSKKFYEDHLRLETKEEVMYEGEKRIFMSASDSHHELVLLEARKEDFLPNELRQLQQIAFEVTSHEELVEYYEEIKETDIPHVIMDNQVSLSLYFPDPDSVTIELYWDIQSEPFGERQWRGNQVKITEEQLRNPSETLTR